MDYLPIDSRLPAAPPADVVKLLAVEQCLLPSEPFCHKHPALRLANRPCLGVLSLSSFSALALSSSAVACYITTSTHSTLPR